MSHFKKNTKLEHYQFLAKLCMYIGPVFLILSVLCGLGYNHYSNKAKELKENQQDSSEIIKKGASLDFSIKQTTIIRINWANQPYDGSLGLLVYSMALVNSSKEPLTIKDIRLEFDLNEQHYSETPINLITGTVWNEIKKKSSPSLLLKINKEDTLYILNWHNIYEKILEGILLPPGAILQGSAFYLLHISAPVDFNKIKNLTIVITDYLGNKTTTPINFEENTVLRVMTLIQKEFYHVGE